MLGHDNYHINTATGDNGHLAYLEAYQSYFISSVKRYDNIQLAYDYIQFIYAHTHTLTHIHTHTHITCTHTWKWKQEKKLFTVSHRGNSLEVDQVVAEVATVMDRKYAAAVARTRLKFRMWNDLLSDSWFVRRPRSTWNRSFSERPHNSAHNSMLKQFVIMFHQFSRITTVAGQTQEECWNTSTKDLPHRIHE